jgi:hypothetical protein
VNIVAKDGFGNELIDTVDIREYIDGYNIEPELGDIKEEAEAEVLKPVEEIDAQAIIEEVLSGSAE